MYGTFELRKKFINSGHAASHVTSIIKETPEDKMEHTGKIILLNYSQYFIYILNIFFTYGYQSFDLIDLDPIQYISH